MADQMLRTVRPVTTAMIRMVKGGCAVQRPAMGQPPVNLSLAWRQRPAAPQGHFKRYEANKASWLLDDPRAIRTGRSAGSFGVAGRSSSTLERLVTFSRTSFLVQTTMPSMASRERSARRTNYRTTRLGGR